MVLLAAVHPANAVVSIIRTAIAAHDGLLDRLVSILFAPQFCCGRLGLETPG